MKRHSLAVVLAAGVIFARGRPLRKVHRDEIFDALFEYIEKDGWK